MTALAPGSPEWCRRVSPSKAAAILGISPWDSQRAMYHKMRSEAPWDEETPAMERGTLCEPAVLAWWRKHHEHTGWREQVTLTIGDWLVATPDGLATVDGHPEVVQAKTTGSQMDEWGDPGTDVVPAHILVQVYLEMEVCHHNGIPATRANIPVLGGYRNLFSNYVVEYDAAIGADLMQRMEAWRDILAAGEPPELDDSVATYDVIRKLHKDIDTGAEVELDAEDAYRVVMETARVKEIEARCRYAKGVVLDRMGRAQYATHNGARIARRQADGPDRTKFIVVGKPSDLEASQEPAA